MLWSEGRFESTTFITFSYVLKPGALHHDDVESDLATLRRSP